MTSQVMNGNGKAFHDSDVGKPPEPNFAMTTLQTVLDFILFISVSIGYILQDLYYMALGYPEKDLKNDIALVTGGGSGIGRLLATRLSKMGTKVVIWDINQQGINETVDIVQSTGGYCKGYVVDISKKEDVYKAADQVRRDVGDVTLLINNAGVVSGRLLLDTPDHLIERSFNVNVMAHFWTTKAFLPQMIENDCGHIVTIASLAGHVGISKLVDYCASKFAAVGFDEALRLELDVLGHQGVQTTCICPYFIGATGMFDDVNARWVPILKAEDVADRIIKAIKTNEKVAVIPGYIKILLSLKWVFPWGCNSQFLRRLVPDAAPHQVAPVKCAPTPTNDSTNYKINPNTDISNGIGKSAAMLVKRTPSVGERVL
ncbi:unnamed protein product [Hermetia illucens]|uniref:Uncharacterized protein n=1 Tax=Hermetia illucens TaxID=343691 RepID=A0A7R8UEH6_HERIL|nr:estradiol 17-beta-dehydrogenase 11 isoform X2 [Hermetia illucens]CAD7079224.1 unnamed protein product [Hermetia illucens]